jgi:hypothetical protein
MVGKIAGAIYGDIVSRFPIPPLMLVPALTFKVKKTIEPFTDLRLLSQNQRRVLAHDIQMAIIPILFSYEIDSNIIQQVAPAIEVAANKALEESL